MDLVGAAWRASSFESGVVMIVPPNYGSIGSGILTTNGTPINTRETYDPHNPQFNQLLPVVWEEYVLHPDEVAALAQVGLIQVPDQQVATYSPPGVASIQMPQVT